MLLIIHLKHNTFFNTIMDFIDDVEPNGMLGLEYQGGIIAYVDKDNGTGLIVAKDDLTQKADWGCDSNTIFTGLDDAYGSGADNTDIIDNTCSGNIAAQLCNDAVIEGYSDWHLPNVGEFDELLILSRELNRKGLLNQGDGGVFDNFFSSDSDGYWTSSYTTLSAPLGVISARVVKVVTSTTSFATFNPSGNSFTQRLVRPVRYF